MNKDIKHIVESFFDNNDINITPKKRININDMLNFIKIGDPLYYNPNNGGLSLVGEDEQLFGRCVMTAGQTVYKRPVFMYINDVYPGASELCPYGPTPKEPFYDFRYFEEPEEDMDGFRNTDDYYAHMPDKKNIKFSCGGVIGYYSAPIFIRNDVHENAYIASAGEWRLIKENILSVPNLRQELGISPYAFFWTSTMQSYTTIYRFSWDNGQFSYCEPYNTFRVRPLIKI